MEETWRLKIQSLWMLYGYENTKKFQAYAKGRKITNTIWWLLNLQGERVTYFDGMANVGVQHFGNLFKERSGTNIAEVVQIAQFFPTLMELVDNQIL